MEGKIFESQIVTQEYLGHGSSGTVFSCLYLNNQYAYKELTCEDDYRDFIKPGLEKISEFYGDSSFAFPYKLIYSDSSNNLFCGYLMDYLKGYEEFCELDLSHKEKLHVLYKAREVLDKFHRKYKHIHTDINSWNFSYNQNTDSVILMDFDTCIDLNKKDTVNNNHLNLLAHTYCKHHGCDIDLDIFMFNLLTFSVLNNVKFYDVINHISINDYGYIENNSAIKILKKYDDIEFNKLEKEYVIDYL